MNASTYACDILRNPSNIRFSEKLRLYQGCPTIAVTRGGRIYLGWYAGGLGEPRMENYNLLIYSDDAGQSWSEPLLVIPSSRERCIHALDIQLFMDPDGRLHVCWVQNNVCREPELRMERKPGKPLSYAEGWMFDDFQHSEWEVVCEDPDAQSPEFSDPRYLCPGFLRCKPTFLSNGDWLFFSYDQLSDRYTYSISRDGGRTFTRHQGTKKLATFFDETMAWERTDGSIRMFARSSLGELVQSISRDGGLTWTEARLSGIDAADSRFWVGRLSSGRVMLICNDCRETRRNMTIALSEDDGETWAYKKCIDTREAVSYPDADEHDGVISLTYDRERTGAREILFAQFTEDDVIADRPIGLRVVSKPPMRPKRAEVLDTLLEAGSLCVDGAAAYAAAPGREPVTGAACVLTPDALRHAAADGAGFVIMPHVDPEMIHECGTLGVVAIAGALTPTEAAAAMKAGAPLVAITPASLHGPEYVRQLKKLLPGVRLAAYGGVTEHNAQSFRDAGADVICLEK